MAKDIDNIRMFGNRPISEQLRENKFPLVGETPTCPVTGEACPPSCRYSTRLRVIGVLAPDSYNVLALSGQSIRQSITYDLPSGESSGPFSGPLEQMANDMSGLLVGFNNMLAESAGISPENCRRNKLD